MHADVALVHKCPVFNLLLRLVFDLWGYGYEDCTACSNSLTAPDCHLGNNCLTGTAFFGCTTCQSGYSLIEGLCLLKPYAYNAATLLTPVIDMNFNAFQQYYAGILQNGGTGNTWGPFNSPDSDDPIPVKSRGMYFDGVEKYLVSTSNVVLNYKATVSLWGYPQNGNTLIYTFSFFIHSWEYCSIIASNAIDYVYLSSVSYQSISNAWQFQGYVIDFVSNTLTISYTDGSVVNTIRSLDGYAYYDFGSTMLIGTDSTNYYAGFIYSITIWQTAITDLTSQYDTCGTGLGNYCVWQTGLGYYYNSYENAYVSCETSCTSGCATWGTCAECEYADCTTCTNFNAACTSTGVSQCLAGYRLSSGKMCCNSACDDCYGPKFYNCVSCNIGFSLLTQICVSSCPLGYSSTSSICVESRNPFLSLTIDGIQDQVLDTSQGIVFETGRDTNFYPNGELSDPIPALNRGYYFTTTSYMTSQLIILPYNFTMIFYIKQISGGMLLSKSLFTINTSGSVEFSIISVITAEFDAIPSSDWTVMVFSLCTEMDGTTTASITFPQITYSSSQSSASVIYIDTSSPLILGASSCSFVGFLYQFQIYIYPQSVSTLSASMCSTSSDTGCLWNCDALDYLSGSKCTSCSASCTGGCVRGADCNLCQELCVSCSNFNAGSCTSCIIYASLVDGVCSCNAGWYWDGTASCDSCNSICTSCSSFTACTSCIDNADLFEGVCSCDAGRYWDGISSCSFCSTICTTCSSLTVCESCVANAGLAGGLCTCNSGWYWDEVSSCSLCNSICATCSGPAACSSCISEASVVNGMCSCDQGWYWDGISACISCSEICMACSSLEVCDSCVINASLGNGVCTCDVGWYSDGNSCKVCDASCVTCTGPASSDCICVENSIKIESFCICNSGFFLSNKYCLPCDASCSTCLGPTYYECTSCLNFLLEVVCVDICPIGFFSDDNQCTLEVKWEPTVEFVFDSIQGVFYDKISGVGALTGQSESYYPSLDRTDPIPAYQRGLYFTGAGSYLSLPYPSDFTLLLGIRFFISTWINPVSTEGSLFYKSLETTVLFSASIKSLYLQIIATIDHISYSFTTSYSLFANEWNHVLISVGYSGYSNLCVAINKDPVLNLLGVDAPFVDAVANPLYVGATSSLADLFQGFIYSISIYCWDPSLDSLATHYCNKCTTCPPSGICIPTCNITEFYSVDIQDCISCNSACIAGCVNSEDCNLCQDPNCLSCSSSEKNSCTECKENYQVSNFTCVECDESQYYDFTLRKCGRCKELCTSCLNEEHCTSCVENSSLNLGYQCECNEGFNHNNTLCSRNVFGVFLSINNQNQATITFTEPLSKNLTTNDITVIVQNNPQSYQLTYTNDCTFLITITFTQNIYTGDTMNITFTTQIVSNLNSLLDKTFLVGDLFAGSYSDVVSEINSLNSYALIGLAAGLSTVLGTSALNLDPLGFFNFLNNLQIYVYIVLYQVNLDSGLVSFLSLLNAMSQIPNPLAFIVSSNEGVQITGRMNDFGNNTNLLVLNS